MPEKAGEEMLVYWDLVALWNLALDYFLLLAAAKLAGLSVPRRRLLAGALCGAAFAAVQLLLPRSSLLLIGAFVLLCAAAYRGTGRAMRLSLLFLLLCCAFGGAVLLLGRMGGMERIYRGLFLGELPWTVFFLAAASSYLLLFFVFRGGAKHRANDFVRAEIRLRGRTAVLRLLCDTGNTLRDSLTGRCVPVIEKDALRPLALCEADRAPSLRYAAVGVGEGWLETVCCDELLIDNVPLGKYRLALSPTPLGGDYQGLWCAKEGWSVSENT